MITVIRPLAAGNALRLFLEPPVGAVQWRVLRKGSDSFTGPVDDYAVIAYEGDDRSFVDAYALNNDVPVFYRPYYYVSGQWVAGETRTGTPAATYKDHSTDTVYFLRERLERGLQVECQRGNFQPEQGYIPVYSAPPSLEQNIPFPLVTVQLEHEAPLERSLGEDLIGDDFGIDGWEDSEGWLSGVRVSVVGWSLNSDERIDLRKAIRRIIVANLPVLDGLGFQQVDLTLTDLDAVSGEYGNSNVYQVLGSFSCIAPVRVSHPVSTITDVTSELIRD